MGALVAAACAAERPPSDPPADRPLPASFAPLAVGSDCRVVDATDERADIHCPLLGVDAAVASLRQRALDAGFAVEGSGGLDREPPDPEGTDVKPRRLRVQGLASPSGARVYLGWFAPKEPTP